MLDVVTLDVPNSQLRYRSGSASIFQVIGFRYLTFANVTRQRQSFRPPGEYLRDRGYFDRFRNNAVENSQWKGSIYPNVSLDGTHVGTFSAPTNWTIESAPPGVRIGKNVYFILNYGDFVLHYDREDDSGHQIRYFGARGWCVGNTLHFTVVTVSCTIRHDKVTNFGATALGAADLAKAYAAQGKSLAGRNAVGFASSVFRILLSLGASVHVSTPGTTLKGTFTQELDLQSLRYSLEYLRPHLTATGGFSKQELSIHARDVIESINDFGGNALAYAGDLRSTGDSVRALLSLPKDLTNPKAWAKTWLSLHYGDRLTISDTHELLEGLRRALLHRQQYTLGRRRLEKSGTLHYLPSWTSNSSYTISRTSTIVVVNTSYNGVMTAIENLMRWDAWPTLENVWDMIPLSFVVDWVLPVSDLLSQIDAAVEAPYLKTETQYVGERLESRCSLDRPSFTGQVMLVTYSRRRHNVLADVRPFDVAPSLPSFSVVNFVDTLALLGQ